MGRTLLAGLAAAAVALAVLLNGDDPYRLELRLGNASGLISGAPVTIGSVPVGKVSDLRLNDAGTVVAELELDDREVGRGATADIRASNLLGSKLVELDPGDTDRPLPSGAVLPRGNIRTPVDIQDVLDVLDADTRTRLAILVNETGIALTGRQADFNTLIARLPGTLDAARTLLDELNTDNRALGDVVERSDQFIGRVTEQRADLRRLVDVMGGTFETLAARRAELRDTLRRAPGALQTLRAFLGDLEATTIPLGPAARAVQRTAPPLTDALESLPDFTTAATPTLREASDTAPALARLARRATPVLRRLVPTARTLAGLSRDLAPATSALGISIDDTLAVLEGWARAIQQRDGIAHYFRADVSVSPDVIQSILNKQGPDRNRRRALPAPTQTAVQAPPNPASARRPGPMPKPPLLDLPLDNLPGVRLPAPAHDNLEQLGSGTQGLLDYLLAP